MANDTTLIMKESALSWWNEFSSEEQEDFIIQLYCEEKKVLIE